MAKQRVFEIAKRLNFDKRELVTKINDMGLGFTVSDYMSWLTEDEVSRFESAVAAERDKTTVQTRLTDTVIRRRSKVRRRKVMSADPPVEAADAVEAPVPQEEAPAEPADKVRRRKVEPVAEIVDAPVVEEETPAVQETPVVEAPEVAPPVEEEVEPAVVKEAAVEEKVSVKEEVAVEETPPATVKDSGQPVKVEAVAVEPPKKKVVEVNTRRSNQKAKILGQIDPEILKARLAAEGKTFTPRRDNDGPQPRGRGPVSRGKPGEGRPDAPRRDEGGRGGRRGGRRSRRTVGADQLYDDSAKIRRLQQRRRKNKPGKTVVTQAAVHKRVIKVNEAIILSDLARQMGIKASDIIRSLMQLGEMYTINQAVDVETASMLAEQFDYKVENVTFDMTDYIEDTEDDEGKKVGRAPVITIMGHVDHGKTSLLDALRKSNITSGEHGGITQHIGAYQVKIGEQDITFLDTPGHEAFTALRARGAQSTDIVILVVAADDGAMPQTVEAIAHAKDADVPIVVAVNKIDKVGANPERVKQALTEYELIPEEWGGTTQFIEVSALQNTNLEALLESVLLQAEMLELKANPDRRAKGLVIESRLDIGHGPMATVLVQEGTLKIGDYIVAGENYGRVRTIFNDHGNTLDDAGPSVPAQVTGLSGVPEAGQVFFVVADEKTAKDISSHFQKENKEKALAKKAKGKGGLEAWLEGVQEGNVKELKVIVKADVQGSVEAVSGTLMKLGNEEVRVEIIHSAVGGITKNDVNLAASSPDGAVIVGFNVRPEARTAVLAEEKGIELILHSVIYDVEAVIKGALEGMLDPILSEEVIGRIDIREIFSVPKIGTVAGCFVQDGIVKRGSKCRLVRDGKIVYTSTIGTLRRFKDDVKEVKGGFECGLSISNYNDIKQGDKVEVFQINEEAAKLS
jgi:translation initiation factor IF-2